MLRFFKLNKLTKCSPLVRGELPFREDVCNLALSVHVPDADCWVFLEDLKQEVQIDPLRSGAVTQHQCSLFNGHFNDGFVVFKYNELAVTTQRR